MKRQFKLYFDLNSERIEWFLENDVTNVNLFSCFFAPSYLVIFCIHQNRKKKNGTIIVCTAKKKCLETSQKLLPKFPWLFKYIDEYSFFSPLKGSVWSKDILIILKYWVMSLSLFFAPKLLFLCKIMPKAK